MSYLTEAVKVLERAGKPLHVMEIYHGVVRAGNWESRAKDPSKTAWGALLRDIKKHGEQSTFVQTDRATFGLRTHDSASRQTAWSKPGATDKRQSPPRATRISFTNCAEKVLDTFADEQPLSCAKITEIAIREGLLHTRGRTPATTMSSRIGYEIRRQQERGESPRFVRFADGTVGLSKWTDRGAAKDTEAHRVHDSAGQQTARNRPNARGMRKSPPPGTRLSFTDSAEWVLENLGNKQPLHYKKITDIAIKRKLLHTQGRTPETTMSALIGSEIRRQHERGESPRFMKFSGGTVGLSKWIKRGLAKDIEAHNEEVRKKLHKRLLDMDPVEFEELVQRLLEEMGFRQTEVTPGSKDGGIDVRGTLHVEGMIPIKVAVQAKRWKPSLKVQAPEVQRVRGSLGVHEQGIIVTTSDFSQGARDEAKKEDKAPIALIDGDQLVTLLTRHSGAGEVLGVSRSNHQLLELSEEFSPPKGRK